MAKFNAIEKDLELAKRLTEEVFDGELPKEIEALFQSSEMGMRSFRVLACIRPLLISVWDGMASKTDNRRFAVEKMIRQIDDIIGYWVLPDDTEDEKEEDDIVEN